jgi:biopolymer transport protein ExbD
MSAPTPGSAHRKKLSRSKHGTLHELNITPLLDLVMVLLVIFMITTPQLSNDIDLSLPSRKPPKVDKLPEINRVEIDKNGGLTINGTAVEVADLPPVFAALKKKYTDPVVVIRGNDEVRYEKVIAVMDLLQQSDITKVALDTAVRR